MLIPTLRLIITTYQRCMENHTVENKFARELEELRIAYLQTLPDKSRLIKKAWHSLDFENWDVNQFKSVYRLVHNLAGGAGTYGFLAISSHARMIMAKMQPGISMAAEDIRSVGEMIDLLEEITNRVVLDIEQETHVLRKPPASQLAAVARVGEVFIVEDDYEQAEYLSLILKQAGYKVQVFNSLKESVSAVKTHEPLAILMDMMFPEGDLAGAEIIKNLQNTSSVPVIFISSRDDLEARLSAVRAGAWYYFTKPVNVSKLVDILNSYLKKNTRQSKKILLVDDDLAVASLFASHLKAVAGLEPVILTEPLRLLEVMDECVPDLILMDYHMPDCNGLELSAVIRQHEMYKNLPIIFLTEETNMEAQLTAMNIGSDDFFSKAMGPDRLVLALQARIERIEKLKETGIASSWSTN